MSSYRKKIDIVTFSLPLKNKLRNRLFKELNLTYNNIVENAKEDGIEGINKPNLSRYFRSDKPASGLISQRSLLYLAYRYGIIVKLKILSKQYNEKECKDLIKTLF